MQLIRLDHDDGYSTISATDGAFRFEGVEPGTYTLQGTRSGYISTNYGANASRRTQKGRALILHAAQQLTDVDFRLIPQGVISGKIFDPEGDPASDIGVEAIRRTWESGKLQPTVVGSGSTDDRGDFGIRGLEPGRYYLRAEPQMTAELIASSSGKSGVRPVRTYFPGAANLQGASVIQVNPGQEVSDTNIQLQAAPAFHVRGKVAGDASAGVWVSLQPALDPSYQGGLFDGMTVLSRNGSFDIAAITPGSYVAVAYNVSGLTRQMGSQAVEVVSSDVNDLVINVLRPSSILGQVRIEGSGASAGVKPDFRNSQVNLLPHGFAGFAAGSVRPDGTFEVENVGTVSYNVNLSPLPSGTYLASVLFGGRQVQGNEVDLSHGVSGKLDIVLRFGVAEVHGAIQTSSNKSDDQASSAKSGFAFLVPEAAGGAWLWEGRIAQDGTFTVKDVPPGRYRAYAFAEVNDEILHSPEVLNAIHDRGVDVELKENDKKQIQLSLISADDFDQILARLGIDEQ